MAASDVAFLAPDLVSEAEGPVPVPAPAEGRLGYRFVKRAFDIAFSLCAIAVLLVPSIVLCVAIRLESPGCPIYSQKRVGRIGRGGEARTFDMYKFRSMHKDADERLAELAELNEADGPLFKIKDDPRIDSRIIETNARRPLLALVFASVFPPKNTVVSTMFPQVNSRIIPPAEAVGKFFAQTGRKTTQFSQKLAKRIFALSEGLNNRVRIPSGAAGFIQPASA